MVMTEHAMSAKEKRVMEAHRLRYMEDCSNKEIASRLGVSLPTIERYFSSSENEKFKRFYSDQGIFNLQKSIEQDLSDAESIAKEALGEAKKRAEDSSDYRQVAEAALKIRERKINLLQELNILEKPTEKKKVESEADTDELRQELVEGLREKREELVNDGE
jgi:DNA-binding transcriptional regulator LsrR (DeoR family)